MSAPSRTAPEVYHLIGLVGRAHGYAKLTATTESGRIEREDGRGPWEPLEEDGKPSWFRVSSAIAQEWTADDENEERVLGAGDDMAKLLDEIGRTVSLWGRQHERLIRATEAWRAVR